ncbi:MAG: hypothetical protein R3C13_14310 [Hyphomonas sp.]|uniref:hypothetical protein n=1 Tax=Hyphomonas sp. TaxID=87 RepID=UPI003528EBC8
MRLTMSILPLALLAVAGGCTSATAPDSSVAAALEEEVPVVIETVRGNIITYRKRIALVLLTGEGETLTARR